MTKKKSGSSSSSTTNHAELCAGLCAFLDESPTPFHATEQLAKQLFDQGYEELDEADAWSLSAGGQYFVRRNQSSIVAWRQGKAELARQGWRILGAHTDSPCLKVKPNPDLYQHGCWRLGVEVYGGVLLNPWFDRDLSLAGRVHYSDDSGQIQNTLVDFKRALGTVPSLAIHLDREANKKRSINEQKQLPVLMAMGEQEQLPSLKTLLKEQIEAQGEAVAEILDYELAFYDIQPAGTIGVTSEFIASARLDNLLSCYVDLQAFLNASDDNAWPVLVCNDHEEVGSQSASGAAGPFLQQVLLRIAGDGETYSRAVAQSSMISTDNAHGLHPNSPDKMEPEHAPLINAGPVIKINANQRYASNSETQAQYRSICRQADVPVQQFVVRSDMACGSTIGPITSAELGVKTLDVGVPTFAMHSIRELAGVKDIDYLYRSLCGFLTS